MSIYFIVGMPRSGTTYMSSLLNNQKDIVSTGETLFWGRQFLETKDNIYNEKEIIKFKNYFLNLNLDNFSVEEKQRIKDKIEQEFKKIQGPSNPKVIFDAFSNSIKKTFHKNIFIEKTPHHIQHHQRILANYPKTKFIVLMRNPYEFVLSYKFQGSQKNETIRGIFEKIYHPIAAALVWRRNYISINELIMSYPDKVLLIRNESLNEDLTLKKLQSFLGISEIIKKNEIRFSSFEKISKKPELEPIDIFWINFVAKKHIIETQYKLEKAEIKLKEILISLLSIIPTLYSIFRLIPTRTNKIAYFITYFKKK